MTKRLKQPLIGRNPWRTQPMGLLSVNGIGEQLRRRQVSRRTLLLGSVLGLAACSGRDNSGHRTATSTPEPTQVHLDFENGRLGPPITQHVGAKISQDFARTGRYGCRLEPLKRNDDHASLVISKRGFGQGRPWADITLNFRLVTSPKASDKYMNLFEIGTTATKFPKSQFTVFFKHGKLMFDFNSSESVELSDLPAIGTWHTVRAVVGFGDTTYRARVQFDDDPVKKLASKDDKSAETVKALWIHYPTVPVDYTMDIDDLKMGTFEEQPAFPS